MASLGNSPSDHIQINVGGRIFSCSKITLTSFSGYFASMLSKDWKGDDVSTMYFIDQDPDAFQILLSYMRNGFIQASAITETVLVQAEFLGIDPLIQAVKCSSYRYLHNHHSQDLQEEHSCHWFDRKYGGILSAIHQGILPQSIQPSVRGHKEYAHLGISNDAVAIPTPSVGSNQKFLPCLMTKLILPANAFVGSRPDYRSTIRPPPSEESSSSSTTEPQYSFPTLIESLNWLHRNGYLDEEENQDLLLHCCADIYDQQPVDPRFIQLFGHTWFSRRVVDDKGKDNDAKREMSLAPYWDSPILYDVDFKRRSKSLDRPREFAALVSLYPEYQGDPLKLEFAVTSMKNSNDDTGAMNRLKVIDDAADVGFVSSCTKYIHTNPVQWLATEGYTKTENRYSKLLQQLYREASSKAYLWEKETVSRIHVRVFSRDLVE